MRGYNGAAWNCRFLLLRLRHGYVSPSYVGVGAYGGSKGVTVYVTANDGVSLLSNAAAELNSLTISKGIATATCLGAGVTLKDGGTVDNCVICSSRVNKSAGNGSVYNQNGTVKNSSIHDNRTSAKTSGVYQTGASAILTGCMIYNNHFAIPGNAGYYGAGVYMDADAGLVSNCVITNNVTSPRTSDSGGTGGGIRFVCVAGKGAGSLVANCVFSGNAVDSGDSDWTGWDAVSSIVVSNCCFSTDPQKIGVNPQAGAPNFEAGTYRPSATSDLLRDKGFTSEDLHGTLDLDGGVRDLDGLVRGPRARLFGSVGRRLPDLPRGEERSRGGRAGARPSRTGTVTRRV